MYKCACIAMLVYVCIDVQSALWASAFVDPRITPDTLTFNCAVISILPLHWSLCFTPWARVPKRSWANVVLVRKAFIQRLQSLRKLRFMLTVSSLCLLIPVSRSSKAARELAPHQARMSAEFLSSTEYSPRVYLSFRLCYTLHCCMLPLCWESAFAIAVSSAPQP